MRQVLSVADQGFIAASNLLWGIAFARASGVDGLEYYAITSTVFLVCLGLLRTLVLEPWLSLNPEISGVTRSSVFQLTSILVGVCLAGTFMLTIVMENDVAIAAPSAAVVASLLMQDYSRHRAYKVDSVSHAVASDFVLFAGSLIALVQGLSGEAATIKIAWTWAAVALVACLPGADFWRRRRAGYRPQVTHMWRNHFAPRGLRLFQDSAGFTLGVHGPLLILGYTATVNAAAEVRAVLSAFSPISLVTAGLCMQLLPRMAAGDVRMLGWKMLGAASVVGALCLAPLSYYFGPVAVDLMFAGAVTVPGYMFALASVYIVLSVTSSFALIPLKVAGRLRYIANVRLGLGCAAFLVMLGFASFQTAQCFFALLIFESTILALCCFRVMYMLDMRGESSYGRAA